jgi:hypothetical protein
LGALLMMLWCVICNRHRRRHRRAKASPEKRLSRAMELREPKGIGDDDFPESVVLDSSFSTTTTGDHDDTNSRSRKTHRPPPDISSLFALTEEPTCSLFHGDDEEEEETTMSGYSICGMDVGTLLPSLSNGNIVEQQREQPKQEQQSSSASMTTSFSSDTLPVDVVQRTVKAPPGKLGLTMVISPEGPKVRYIQEDSPMDGVLFVGDVIVDINDVDTRPLTIPAIFSLLKRANDLTRSITVLTMDDTARNGLFLC